jgi:hypothetical protein
MSTDDSSSTNPRNGFVSAIWGPQLWFVLHCISLNFPLHPTPTDRARYRHWFEGLEFVLPCGACRSNFAQNLRDLGYDPVVDFDSRLALAFLVYRLHNQVRLSQHKIVTMTFWECLCMYERFRARDCTEKTDTSEGGCFARRGLMCHIRISSDHDRKDDSCRYQVDKDCGI